MMISGLARRRNIASTVRTVEMLFEPSSENGKNLVKFGTSQARPSALSDSRMKVRDVSKQPDCVVQGILCTYLGQYRAQRAARMGYSSEVAIIVRYVWTECAQHSSISRVTGEYVLPRIHCGGFAYQKK